MRLLITEFIAGGGMANHPIPEGLKQEGLLMLRSVLSDCMQLDGVDIVTTVDDRFELNVDTIEKVIIRNADEYLLELSRLASQCDAVWVIAPESDRILQIIIEDLTAKNVKLINCDANSISLTSDKRACTDLLRSHNLPVVENFSNQDAIRYQQETVIKHRFGVGGEGLKILQSGVEALTEVGSDKDNWLIQPFESGDSLSLSILCVKGEAEVLSCNKQIFSESNEPKLKMCRVNAMHVTQEFKKLANDIARVLPGLNAYVGVDFIDCNGVFKIVDINPRLTTSYAGLNNVLNINPAKLCLEAALFMTLPENLHRNATISEVAIG